MRFYKAIPEKNIFVDKIFKWIVDIIVVAVLAVFFVDYFGERTSVIGNSMSSVLKNEDDVLIDTLTYRITEPNRNDVVAFEKKEKNGDKVTYIKRIIGLPGETIQIKDGVIYINDKKFESKIKYEQIVNSGLIKQPVKLSYDEYFVIGDNINSSEDSRFSTIGNVKSDEIIGKIWIKIAPFVRIGLVK